MEHKSLSLMISAWPSLSVVCFRKINFLQIFWLILNRTLSTSKGLLSQTSSILKLVFVFVLSHRNVASFWSEN